jgi:hypothetical protein
VLRQHLWPRVRAAVLTSATLTSCGRFDFFLAESGLAGDPDASALEVPSPFDFAAQGRFEVVHTRSDPRQAAAFTTEMIGLLMADLKAVESGALVLFTSRDQMRQAVAWTARHIGNLNDQPGNPGRLSVAGHSAGGHIVGMLLSTRWAEWGGSVAALPGQPDGSPIRHGISISGLFDLEPIRQTPFLADLGLTPEEAQAQSPIHHRHTGGQLTDGSHFFLLEDF